MEDLKNIKQVYNRIERTLIAPFESYKLIEKILFVQTAYLQIPFFFAKIT